MPNIYTVIDNNVVVQEVDDNDETSYVSYTLGLVTKTETVRIDNELVEDISYSFDLVLGAYVEQSREQRYFPDPDAVSPVDAKIAELNAACNEAILAGFTSDALGSPHTYDFDYEAQINFIGTKDAFKDGIITEIKWKTDAGEISHNQVQFTIVYYDGFAHKNTNIQRYKTLKAAVYAAISDEEREAIQW